MPISAKTFLRSNILLLAAGLVALLAIVVASVWLVGRTQAQVEGVLAVRQVRSAFADLRNLVQETETGQRGYLLTGEDSYLAPYTTSRSMVAPQIERLKTLVTPFPDLVEPTRELIGVIERKLAELDHTVDLHKSGRHDEALAILRDNSGQELMDRARALFDSLVTVADRKLVDHTESQNRSAAALRLVSMVGAAVILAVVGGSVWTVLRYTSDLAEARTTVEALNAGLEERVKERTVDLARANDEIQRFAYIVTHDLRAPLVNIMGFTSELEAGLEPIRGLVARLDEEGVAIDEAARTAAAVDLPEAVGFIRSSTRKMDGLINAILKISREGRRALKTEPVDLGELTANAAAAIHHQLEEAGGTIDVDVRLPAIHSDRLSLEQVFGNLLDNAVKYRDDARPLTIRVTGAPEKHNRIRIEFADNGRGIAPQDHERVFELFRRSGSQDKAGEGIGLAHVRSSLRNLGGDIILRSELGKGTTFVVTLPRSLPAALRRTET
ncbi:MAG: CHASE3 domain-containing protein [Mesorhizobium sp.]